MMTTVWLFLAGAFLVNGIPHFVQGVSGNRFQSPFASPPGVGESSPLVNVLWGVFNFASAYGLLAYCDFSRPGRDVPTASLLAGGLIMSVVLSIHFDRVRNR